MEETSNLVSLVDEEGNSLSFEYLMAIDYDGKEYVVLAPRESYHEGEELDGDEVVILKVEQDKDGEDIYLSIEDEKELDDVFYAFNEIMAQDED